MFELKFFPQNGFISSSFSVLFSVHIILRIFSLSTDDNGNMSRSYTSSMSELISKYVCALLSLYGMIVFMIELHALVRIYILQKESRANVQKTAMLIWLTVKILNVSYKRT